MYVRIIIMRVSTTPLIACGLRGGVAEKFVLKSTSGLCSSDGERMDEAAENTNPASTAKSTE